MGCVIGNPKSLCRREHGDKDLSCREYRHLRWRRRPYSPIDRIKPHPSIGRGPTPKFPSPSGDYLPPLCGYYYHWRGKRGGRWERQTQSQNASRAPPTLGIQKTITTLYPQLPLRRTVATSKHTPLLNLEARVGQAHVKSTCCESQPGNDSSISSAWHIPRARAKRQDRHQPTNSPLR